jgi:hypothetical protein
LEALSHHLGKDCGMKTYSAIIWDDDPQKPGRRVSVFAESLQEAKERLEEEYGEGHVFNLHNEEDAGRARLAQNDKMSGERDQYGRLTDPGEAYQEFMLGLHDIEAEAQEAGYSKEACALLHEARLMFMAEFKNNFPGYGKGRAIWE